MSKILDRMGAAAGDAVAAALIAAVELREKIRPRKNPGYRIPCPDDCQEQHLHMREGFVYYAPLGTDWPSDQWVPMGPVAGPKRSRRRRLADWLDNLYQDVNEEDENDA